MGKGHEVMNCPEYNNAFPRLGEDENTPRETDQEKNEWAFEPTANNASITPGKQVTAKANSQRKKSKKKKSRNPAVNVSGGKNVAPSCNEHISASV